MRPRNIRNVAAFTLVELLLVIVIIALLISILLPALADARRTARTMVCAANMKQLGTAQETYASSGSKQSVAGFSWEVRFGPNNTVLGQKTQCAFPDLNNGANQVEVHANQAVDIARRILSRTAADQPIVNNRNMARNFWTLVFADGGYLGDNLPIPATVCPEDADAAQWQKNWSKPGAQIIAETGDPDPAATTQEGFRRMLPFWTTYQMVPAAFLPDAPANPVYADLSLPDPRLYWTPGNTLFNARRLDEVSAPSQKVATFDLWDRHFHSRRRAAVWHAYPSAKQNLLFFDGSVRAKVTRDSNKGWDPRPGLRDNNNLTTRYHYYRLDRMPPALFVDGDIVDGYYRWTRGGLKGVDFGGAEVRR